MHFRQIRLIKRKCVEYVNSNKYIARGTFLFESIVYDQHVYINLPFTYMKMENCT